jgi:hypothetical protein
LEKSEKIDQLAIALAKAQGEFSAVPMKSENPFLKTKYADLGSVIETSKSVLSKNELAFSQIVSTEEGNRVGITTILMHSSGQYISSFMSLPLDEKSGRSLAQSAGSIITYLRRYSLSAILGIHTEEDNDGEKKDKSQAGKPVEKEPTERQIIIDKIMTRAKDLGGSKNEKLLLFMKSFEPSANPNRIKELEKLNEWYKKLLEFKNEEEKK